VSSPESAPQRRDFTRVPRFVWGAIVVLAIWIVPTYIPIINRMLPNVFDMPVADITITQADVSTDAAGNAQFPTSKVNSACEHIPFLLRPIAGPPPDVKVHLVNEGTELGWVMVDCKTKQIVGQHQGS
jgi:hypothetical protein